MKCNILQQDIDQKLADCMFMYKGELYYIHNGGGKKIILSHPWDRGTTVHKIDFDDPEFDIASVPLGYMNGPKKWRVNYIVRVPVRKVKQGICASVNLRVEPLGKKEIPMGSPSSYVYTKGFGDSCAGRFPGLKKAIETLRDQANLPYDPEYPTGYEIAISQDIALRVDQQGLIFVYFRQEYVGWIPPKEMTVYVTSDDRGTIISKYLSHYLDWKVE